MSRIDTFVGRSPELELLDAYVARAVAGDQQLVLIEGQAGIGKTALLLEFGRRHAKTRDARVFHIGAPDGEPYEPVQQAALAATGQRLYRRFGGRRQTVEIVQSVYVDWVGLIPVVGDVLAATIETVTRIRRRRSGDFLPSGASVDENIAALLAAAARKPLVLLMDDLEKADAAQVARLEKLIDDADEGARILIVGAYRSADPGRPTPPVKRLLRTLPNAEEFFVERRLGPLAEAEVRELLEGRFPGTPVPDSLVAGLYEVTGGHAGALAEALAELQVSGGIRNLERRWHFDVSVPMPAVRGKKAPTLDLDALPAPVAEALRAASVLGSEFDSSALCRLLDADELDVEDRLAAAVHLGVLEVCGEEFAPRDEYSTRFRFRSPHLVAVLRAGIPEERRVSLESRVEVGG